MRKFLAMGLVAAMAAVAFGGFNVPEDMRAVPAPCAAVNAGKATTNAVFDVSGCKGVGAVYATYTAAATTCVFTATLQTTNRVDGGWKTIGTGTSRGVTSGVAVVPFSGSAVSGKCRVITSATTANATAAGGVLVTYK